MGSVEAYQSARGRRYRVRYRKPDRREGQKRGFVTKRDAELFLADIEIKKAKDEFIELSAGRVTISTLGRRWLEGRVHWKPSTRLAYESAWKLHVAPYWGDVSIGDVRQDAVQSWLAELSDGHPGRGVKPKSPTIVRRCYDLLAGICDDAVANRRIPRNPARGAKLPRRVSREHLYLSHQQVDELAVAAGTHALVIRMLAYTGLRWGELAGLEVGDLDLDRRRLMVNRTASLVGGYVRVGTPKPHERRSVPYPAFLADALSAQITGRERGDLVFPDRFGTHRRTPTAYDKSWYDAAKAAARLPATLTIHDLRHTAASLAISAGANVKAVQRMLGHASAAMTLDTYADLFPDDLDDVSAALDHAHHETVVAKTWPNPESGQKEKTP